MNPIASIRATKLLGASRAADFGNYYRQREQEFLSEYVERTGTMPSSTQIGEFVDTVTGDFLSQEGNETIAAPGLMNDGFMERTSKFRNEKRVTLYDESAKRHKQVLITNTAKNLKDIIGDDLERLEETSTDPVIDRHEDLQEAWLRNTGPLNSTEQKEVLADFMFRFPAGEHAEAIDALHNLVDAGIKIGNERLGDTAFFISSIDELIKRGGIHAKAKEADDRDLASKWAAERLAEYKKQQDAGGSQDEIEETMAAGFVKIREDETIDEQQKLAREKALQHAQQQFNTGVNRATAQVKGRMSLTNSTQPSIADDFDESFRTVVEAGGGELEGNWAVLGKVLNPDFVEEGKAVQYMPSEEVLKLRGQLEQEWANFVSDGALTNRLSLDELGGTPAEQAARQNVVYAEKQKMLEEKYEDGMRALVAGEAEKAERRGAEREEIEEAEAARDAKNKGLLTYGREGAVAAWDEKKDVVRLPRGLTHDPTKFFPGSIRTKLKTLTDFAERVENTYLNNPEGIPSGTAESNLQEAQFFLGQHLDLYAQRGRLMRAQRKANQGPSVTEYKESMGVLRTSYFRSKAISGSLMAEDLVDLYEQSDTSGAGYTEEGFRVEDVDAFAKAMIKDGFIDLAQADEYWVETLAKRAGMTVEELKVAQKANRDKWLQGRASPDQAEEADKEAFTGMLEASGFTRDSFDEWKDTPAGHKGLKLDEWRDKAGEEFRDAGVHMGKPAKDAAMLEFLDRPAKDPPLHIFPPYEPLDLSKAPKAVVIPEDIPKAVIVPEDGPDAPKAVVVPEAKRKFGARTAPAPTPRTKGKTVDLTKIKSVPVTASTAGAWKKRSDVPYKDPKTKKTRLANVRYNNPAAAYPRKADEKYGLLGYGIIGGNHKIGRFPTPVHGAAANIDLFKAGYSGMTVYDAVRKWRGSAGRGEKTVLPKGYKKDQKIDAKFFKSATTVIDFFRKMALHEGPGSKMLTKAQWLQAYKMFNQGGAKPKASKKR